MPYCRECGSPVDGADRFCRSCGAAQSPEAPRQAGAPRAGPPPGSPSPATKADAIEWMSRALESAKRARASGRPLLQVRRLLKRARTAFENQDWAQAVAISREVLALCGEA